MMSSPSPSRRYGPGGGGDAADGPSSSSSAADASGKKFEEGELHTLALRARWDDMRDLLRAHFTVPKKTGGGGPLSTSAKTESTAPDSLYSADETDHHHDASAERRRAELFAELESPRGVQSFTPLMMACVRAPPDLVALLVECNPRACAVPDRGGSLPLHFVASFRRDEAPADGGSEGSNSGGGGGSHSNNGNDPETCMVLRVLMEPFPESLCARNGFGQTPVHSLFCGGKRPSLGVVQTLLGLVNPLTGNQPSLSHPGEGDGAAGGEAGEGGGGGPSSAQMRAMRDARVRQCVLMALSTPDSGGRMPLHSAAASGGGLGGTAGKLLNKVNKEMDLASQELLLRLLVECLPDAALMADAGGDLPVHLLWNWGRDVASKSGNDGAGSGDTGDGGVISSGSVEALLTPLAQRPPPPGADGMAGGGVNSFQGGPANPYQPSSAPASPPALPPPSNHRDLRRLVDAALRLQEERELERTRAEMRSSRQNKMRSQRGILSTRSHLSHYSQLSARFEAGLDDSGGGVGGVGNMAVAFGDGEYSLADTLGTGTNTGLSSRSLSTVGDFSVDSPGGSGGYAPLTVAAAACRLPGSTALPGSDGGPGMKNLPVHIAAEYGVNADILRGIVENYPQGPSEPRLITLGDGGDGEGVDDSTTTASVFPLELFETGIAGSRAASAADKMRKMGAEGGGGATPEDFEALTTALRSFVERSDLLFAYHPEAVPSRLAAAKGGASKGRPYRRDPDRIARFESSILSEATDPDDSSSLSPTSALVWRWMCSYSATATDPSSPRDNYGSVVGRILGKAHVVALWKLSVCPDPLQPPLLPPAGSAAPPAAVGYGGLGAGRGMGHVGEEDEDADEEEQDEEKAYLTSRGYVVKMRNGNTVPVEHSVRLPSATLDSLLRGHGSGAGSGHGHAVAEAAGRWQNRLTSYLDATDALSYTACCRRTRAGGVRLLDEAYVDRPDGTWEFDTGTAPPGRWQKLEGVLVTPDCAHTVFVTYDLEVDGATGGNGGGGADAWGGLLVVREDDGEGGDSAAKPNPRPPWGAAVVSGVCGAGRRYRPGDEVRIGFRHAGPGAKYSLWYHGPTSPPSGRGGTVVVSVQNVRLRQLVHASDARGRTPLHALLGSKGPDVPSAGRLRRHVHLLLRARFGSGHPGDSVSGQDVPLHYALKCGVSEEVLRALISADPGSLLETDREGRTPLHAAFLLSRDEPPSPGIIKALLSTPGENATKLKDSSVRLPLHIAAERGAGEAILRLLVDAYTDGCYRQNKDGDLPLHLLVRSGRATAATIELLVRPIMSSETICRMPGGGGGVDLPLHIAAEHRCCYKVLETLLTTYGDAARQPRMARGGRDVATVATVTKGSGECALDLFERHRAAVESAAALDEQVLRRGSMGVVSLGSLGRASSGHSVSSGEGMAAPAGLPPVPGTPGGSTAGSTAMDMAKRDVLVADFDLRSDLLFVYNPHLAHHKTGLLYRKDPRRIRRLQTLIRREAVQVADRRATQNATADGDSSKGGGASASGGKGGGLSDMARRAWTFLACFENPADPDDHYADAVRRILRGLPTSVVTVLADVPNPHSKPVPDLPVRECAHPACGHVVLSRIRFVGRYVLKGEESEGDGRGHPVHKSDSCLVMRALDYGAVQEFRRVEKVLNDQDAEGDGAPVDIDDLGSTGGTITHGTPGGGDDLESLLTAFVAFAEKIGVGEMEARREIVRHLGGTLPSLAGMMDDNASVSDLGDFADTAHHHEQRGSMDGGGVGGEGEGEGEVAEDDPQALDARAAARKRNRELYRTAFKAFCRDHQVDCTPTEVTTAAGGSAGGGGNGDGRGVGGVRSVVIKFMMHRRQFRREKSCRAALQRSAVARAEAAVHGSPGGEDEEGGDGDGPSDGGFGNDWSLVPVIEDYDVDRIRERRWRGGGGADGGGSGRRFDGDDRRGGADDDSSANLSAAARHDYPDDKDELYALDIMEKNASIHNFSLYRYALVMPGGDRDLAEICMHEELGILQIREYTRQVALALKRLHEHSVVHGDLKMDNIVRFGSKVALIDLDSACRLPPTKKSVGSGAAAPVDAHDDALEHMGAGSHKFSTGILPPEMMTRVDLGSNYRALSQYEEYWRHVSEDAKDLLLLTPDDVQTITSVVKSLLAKSEAVRKMGTTSLRYNMGDRTMAGGLEDPNKDWKDILSIALITISFEDLPVSLTQCRTVEEFSVVWGRLQANSRLWEKVRPRMSPDGKYAYVVKTFDDVQEEKRRKAQRRDRDGYSDDEDEEDEEEEEPPALPYKLVAPTEKMDVWSFGALLFSLCSGGSLFHVGFRGDLRSPAAFADLHGWTAPHAEKLIQTNIGDPLAQDLLLKVLVPEEDRLANMDAVLRHPFFGPSSGIEAQRILERHEEQQLILEETVTVAKLTTESQRRIEFSTEKQCKIVFDEDKIVVPTCLMVLPYQMIHNDEDDGGDGSLSVPTDPRNLNRAVEIGKHLLDINTSTARLSFWLMMKKNLADRDGSEFKSRMKTWLKRARTEASDVVAREIVAAIGCGYEYIGLCTEMLEKGDAVSNARAYIKDPMSAARRAIRTSTEALLRCYSSQFVYLLDEYRGLPIMGDGGADDGGSVARSVKTVNGIYPLRIDPSANLLQHLLLPFMNITVMTVIAVDRMRGLARALGLPPSYGIPERWRESEPGLVHRRDKPSSVAEFAVLHDVIRKRERRAALRRSQLGDSQSALSEEDGGSSIATGSKSGVLSATASDGGQGDGISEMRQLEMFFRDYDSMRIFSNLRRVSDGTDKGLAIWTTDEVVDKMQADVELASIETRLREIKRETIERDRLSDEAAALKRRARAIRGEPEPSVAAAVGGRQVPDAAAAAGPRNASANGMANAPRQRPASTPRVGRQPEEAGGSTHSRFSVSSSAAPAPSQWNNTNMDYMNPNSTLDPIRPGLNPAASQRLDGKKRKKMRKSNKGKPKLKIRPYFGVC